MGYLLGIDVGSSSVKASLLDAETGKCAGSDFFPKEEMNISAPQPGFAEQNPEDWYTNAISAVRSAISKAGADKNDVKAVGIAYQMHGLVCVDKSGASLRPAIIWCDSRAVKYGEDAFDKIGRENCLQSMLNSPGNFTAAKLAWVKENEPEIFAKIDKVMLPGDWLAMRLTGRAATTESGLSEGIFWDFQNDRISNTVLDTFSFSPELLCQTVPTFGEQGRICTEAAEAFGLAEGTPVTYRAGDQPNNALSLNVLNPGEVAATAGTSGVIYGVTDRKQCDPQSRVNTFLHVNNKKDAPRLGVLMCVSGCGIMNSWTHRLMGSPGYAEMDRMAESVPEGSLGVKVMPFGNGPERMLGNRTPEAQIRGLDLNRHGEAELCRAVQEGIAFAFRYGKDALAETGIEVKTIRAGKANMFLSSVFAETIANCFNAPVELFDTDGALGAARGAGIGAGIYASCNEAFSLLSNVGILEPKTNTTEQTLTAYKDWEKELNTML